VCNVFHFFLRFLYNLLYILLQKQGIVKRTQIKKENLPMTKLTQKQENLRNQKYNEYVKEITPTHNLWANMAKAFVLGGAICVLGQFITDTAVSAFGLDKDTSALWCSLLLVLLSVVLTSLNAYAPLANWGGAGALVPITGFANGVCASAVEFQKEGQVFGIGCQIFKIAGPVILYGIFSSWVLGLIYWILI
jgi:stage V sporulation protein AC